MAKSQINTKSHSYQRDKENFLKELKQFNESKNLPYKTPVINGVEIDLYLFYTLVQRSGGLSRVNQNDWDTFLRALRLPNPCVNGSTLLRRIYGTYLEKYERAKGPPGRDDDNDGDEDMRRGRGGGMPRIAYGGGTYISASGEALRTGGPRVAGPSERLALSLLSPMPNEQDFAVNVCTVLAADHNNRLPLATTPHILDFLLAHAGVYNHSSLRDTIGRSYFEARGRYPHEFWALMAGGGGAKELADETKFMQPGLEQPELMVTALAAHNTLTDCLNQESGAVEIVEKMPIEDLLEDWVTEPSEAMALFAPELPMGASCALTQRVLQVASIVRSLSFHEENVPLLARNTTLIRFLLLCANCWVGSLRQSGLDTLGNISTELIIKEPATCLVSRHVLSTVQAALGSADRARALAALDLLTRLAHNDHNEDALLRALEPKVYQEVCGLLTLRDIMVLVMALECVYALTALGERAAERAARVPGLVRTLVSLVTVEAQSYGPRACILMRVVETVSGPGAVSTADAPPTQQSNQPHQPQPHQTPTHPPQQHQQHHTPLTTQPSQPPKPASPAPAAPVSSLQQSHMQQRTVQENEHFALAWLRSSYEPLPAGDNAPCDATELHRHYAACCAALQRKGVIPAAHFPRLVRTAFGGTVGPNTVTLSTGETSQAYIGIRAKNSAQRNTGQGPSSPILKAQLTNKTGTVEVKPIVTQAQPPPAAPHPHLAAALEPGATNTSLIKHLLAHKVAQRQQNQQQRVVPANTVVVPPPQTAMEVDPEALIKCTTITQGGVASTTPAIQEKIVIKDESLIPKDEPVQIQFDEQAQLTIKTAQNKMLADLLEKKSNPPVQVVQMAPQINAPTIQITETGQIVQVKSDPSPMIQINEAGIVQGTPYFQIKNDQGQIIQIKNEHGQIIQLKSDQLQPGLIQIKNDGQLIQGGQVVQSSVIQSVGKSEKDQIIETVVTDHSYTEPPTKKVKLDEKREPHESVSKTAANLYAALAASALEDEEDLVPPKQESVDVIQPSVLVAGDNAPVIIQEPILQVQQPTLQVQQPTMQVQQPTMQVQQPTLQVQQPTLQVQQPTLQMQPPLMQMQPMDIMASQAQLILQEKPMTSQSFVQQPMQFIATPSTSQGGIGYITQNMPGNMMQKTIIIVQGGVAGGGPLTLTVNNSSGLDEATLNSLITQATEAITQQQIIQNTGVIQSAQRVIVSQPAMVSAPSSQQMTVVKTAMAQNTPQITASQQPIITSQPQPIKAQIVNQSQQQQIVVTQKQPPALITSSGNQIVGNQQILQGGQQIIQGNQQLLQGNQQIIAVSNNQQIIVNAPMKAAHRPAPRPPAPAEKPLAIHPAVKPQQPVMRQVITRQPVMVGNTKIGDKEMVVNTPVEVAKPPTPKPTATPPPPPQDETPWICHWRGCGKVCESAAGVFAHCARAHCPTGAAGEAPCLWADCDRVPRRTFALLNHLGDKHCTAHALKALYNSRRASGAIAAPAGVEGAAGSLGYPPNAALAALNKHATDMFNPRELMHRADAGRAPEQLDENEGPVTKSIRLTAALILRNIVIYSNTGRRQLRSFESHLATIAFSNVEASRTIAQVLYDMNNI